MKKSFTKVLLAAAMFCVSSGASAYDFEVDGIGYNITSEADKTVEVTSGENKYFGDVSIPETVENLGAAYTVTKIGNNAFSHCSGLVSVDIPDGVISIGDRAFSYCSGLESVTLGSRVETIGDYAFDGCSSLASIDIPDGVVSIGEGSFYGCSSLTSVNIPDGVTSIGADAFSGCSSLAEINCCATVPPVCGQYCFDYVDISNCTLSVTEGAEEAYKTADVWKELFYEYFMRGGIKYGIQTSPQGNIAMVVAGGDYTGDITIPATVENGGITYTVTSIRGNAFAECSDLVSVDIPDGVVSIGDRAFYYCSSLESVTLGSGVETIGDFAFSACHSLASIDIPDGVVSIGDAAFSWSGLTSVDIPDGVVSIGESAFSNCSSLESVTLGSGVETIGDYAFYVCFGLTSVDIPDGVVSIGESAFGGCSSLESVTLGSRVETIGDYAFDGCSSLASIDIPDGVTSLGDGAFSYCSSLAEITCRATVPPVCGEICFADVDISNCTLSVPEVAEEAYKTADVWKEFFYEYFISGGIRYGVQTSPQGNIATVVAGGEYTGDITIPATVENGGITYTVTSIRANAFAECSDLVSVDIPDGVTSIGYRAFYYCSSLESVTLGSGVETIGDSAFMGCSNLTSVDIPDGVVSIGDFAFDGCSSLASIDIPDGVISLGYGAFSNCSSLESVTLGSGVETIGDYAFYVCSSLESVTLGSGLETIGDRAFYDCSSLAEITCRATVPPVCGPRSFDYVDKYACTLNVPEGTADDYRAADGWKAFFNIVETDFAGSGEIAADATASAKVYAAAGRIVVENAAAGTPIAVYTADGVQVYGGTVSDGRTEIPAQAGKLYIVRCGNAAYKTAM